MAVDRVSTFNIFNNTLNSTIRLSADLANLQNQLSSGLKAHTFDGLGAQATQYLQLQDKMARISNYIDNNAIIKTRVDTTNTALTQIITTATELQNLIQGNTGASSVGTAFSAQLNNLWRTLVTQLNTNLGGRYLFSGSNTANPAVVTDSFPELEEGATVDDGYYLGSFQDITVNVDDNVRMTYNVRADASGFQKIFAALATAKEGGEQNASGLLNQAFELVHEGIQEVISIRAEVNSNSLTITNLNQNLTSLRNYWKGVSEDISNTDLVAVSTQVAIDQGILQASFQSFARISSLRLSDYLR